jgi:TRAP-type C4-dicarboxylate transport system permease small subunit
VRVSVPRALDRAVASTSLWLAGAGVLCVITMMVLITYEVVARYVFNAPTAWSDEIAAYLLIAIVFLGLAQNLRTGSHIRIDVITNLVPSRARLWLELIAYAVGIVFSVMLCVGIWIRFNNFWLRNTTSDSPLMTPLWLPMLPVLLGSVVFVLAMTAGLMKSAYASSAPPVSPLPPTV